MQGLKTGKSKGINRRINKDVNVVMPSLDLLMEKQNRIVEWP